MKELNSVDLENVSGAGLFSDTLSSVFGDIASTANYVLGNVDWSYIQQNAPSWGQSVGAFIDSALSVANNHIDLFVNSLFRK